MGKFDNKVVLIAGCKGAANEIASIICNEGGKVIVNDPDAAVLEAITAPVAEKFNLSISRDDTKKLIDSVLEKYKVIHSLIVNYDEFKTAKNRIVNYTLEDWDKVIEINVKSFFRLLACIRDHFRECGQPKDGVDMNWRTGDQATIVVMSSLAGVSGLAAATLYSAAKAAVNGMVRNTAKEFGKFANINAIAQGFYSEKKNLVGPKDRSKKFLLINSTDRAQKGNLTYKDVASAAAYLASEDAKMISGQIINVDGGLWLHVQA
ncbi:MAG: SDR family NAD(P)-dependent oxidoreductase [Candidatus Hodarchaeota archaeon]